MTCPILRKHVYCERKVFSARLRYDRGPLIGMTALLANMMREGLLMLLPLEHTWQRRS